MENVTLSVIMPNYNHSRYIGEALEAILSQSYRPMEVIVVDDASTDNSVEIIQRFVERDIVVRLIRNEKNMGVVHTLKKLLELSSGDYVCFPGADDKVLPGFFEKSMNLLAKSPKAGLCSTLPLFIDEEGRSKGILRSAIISAEECFLPPQKALLTLLRYGNWIYGNTTIFRRSALIEAGGYIPELRSFADGFIQEVVALKYGACFIPEPLACWRRMEGGFDSSCGRDPDVQLDIINNATKLMESTYRDLFPLDYVKIWEKKELVRLNINLWSSIHKTESAAIVRLRVPRTLSDKILLAGLKFLAWIELIYVNIYFLVLYRYIPVQILRRNVATFFYKTVLRLKKRL